jgi:hypothetical protein
MDEDISSLYRDLLPGSEAGLRSAQREWLKQRDACADRECVLRALRARRLELLAGADSFVDAHGRWRGIGYRAVGGLKGGNVLWLRFASLNERGSDCNFLLKGADGALVASSGYAFGVTRSGGDLVIRLRAPIAESGRLAEFCGNRAIPPESVRIQGNKLLVEYGVGSK